MQRLKIILAGLAVLLALVVGYGYGCGDSDSGSDGGASAAGTSADATEAADGVEGIAPAVEKSEFIELGDAICRKVPEAYEKLVEPLEQERQAKGLGKPPVAEVNQVAAIPPLRTAIQEFRELEIPSGEEQASEAIIKALEAAKEGMEKKPTSPLSGPESPFDNFQNLTRAYGFTQCNRL